MVYLLSAILTGGVLTAICWPLFAGENAAESAILEETQWDLLQRKKDVVLGNIQDLDFEFKCGKLSDPDYQRIRSEFTTEVAGVYSEIDRIESDQDLDALIRSAVTRRQKKPERKPAPRNCSDCGHTNSAKNKFCAECGNRLR
jgi:hypothetical protein